MDQNGFVMKLIKHADRINWLVCIIIIEYIYFGWNWLKTLIGQWWYGANMKHSIISTFVQHAINLLAYTTACDKH